MAEETRETRLERPRARASAANENSTSIVTPLVVGAAVALIEPELLLGVGIGVAAMLLPKVLPGLTEAVRPLVRSAVASGYSAYRKGRELASEASERVQDFVAEARSEYEEQSGQRLQVASRTPSPRPTPTPRRARA